MKTFGGGEAPILEISLHKPSISECHSVRCMTEVISLPAAYNFGAEKPMTFVMPNYRRIFMD